MSQEIYEWVMKKGEFTLKQFMEKFKFEETLARDILQILEENKVIIINERDKYFSLESATIFKNKILPAIIPTINDLLKKAGYEMKSSTSNLFNAHDWDDIKDIEKFVIFESVENIYEIHFKFKKIDTGEEIKDKVRLEGKEIMDYNVFRLRFFEKFGTLLQTYKGINSDWASLVSYWYRKYGELSKNKVETISDSQEAKELIVDYVNNCSISDTHIAKEGLVCVKDDCLFLPLKIVKKLLKRNDLRITLRKIAYELQDYMISGSVPLKIENKSERFWKMKPEKFDLRYNKEKEKLNLQEENE